MKAFSKKARVGKLVSFLNLDKLAKSTVRVYAMCKNSGSKYVTVPSGRRHFFGELCERKELLETAEAPFESLTVRIPAGYDGYMRRLYGATYMQLPPESDREHHPVMELDFGDKA
ncbi:MAG: LicD family protein, partial [Lachnospiraceae bacterium]|nr:LicD family protein [Lachnospiraceae bacterium]